MDEKIIELLPKEENIEKKKPSIDFTSKEFEDTQKLLKDTAKLNSLVKSKQAVMMEQKEMVESVINNDEPSDIIQIKLDEFGTYEEVEKFLAGDLKNKTTKEHIDYFFTDDETGDVLTLLNGKLSSNKDFDEYDFKRGMLLYIKKNDYYTEQIDKEIAELNKSMEELNVNISETLKPLNDNILGYVESLIEQSIINEDDDKDVRKYKNMLAIKAKYIKNGYTLENLIDLVEKNPGIIKNALSDFRNDQKVKEIGKRYSNKLKTGNIGFNLFGLLADDAKDSLEYRCLPFEYPEGLENFTVFFIIRSMAMGLNSMEDVLFHASVQVCFTKLMDNSMDLGVKEMVQKSILKFLKLFG